MKAALNYANPGPRSATAAPAAAPPTSPAWLADLRAEVERHPAVNHMLLSRLATGRYTRLDYCSFGQQHFALVGLFTKYMELLLLRAPSSEQKLWLAKVLVDEYGEGSDGDDHATLYQDFLGNVGGRPGEELETPLCREIWDFVGEHLRICREEPFLVGLGALGPGHEWAIPKMFSHIIPGLQRAGVTFDERHYFDLHTEQDVDHAQWMSEALEKLALDEQSRAAVRRGARQSLDARYRVWTGIERQIVARRQPCSILAAQTGLHGQNLRPVDTVCPGTVKNLMTAVDVYLSGGTWPL
jgi:pyrroloquinoline quinone (PQQ) biosynthesis protein C